MVEGSTLKILPPINAKHIVELHIIAFLLILNLTYTMVLPYKP